MPRPDAGVPKWPSRSIAAGSPGACDVPREFELEVQGRYKEFEPTLGFQRRAGEARALDVAEEEGHGPGKPPQRDRPDRFAGDGLGGSERAAGLVVHEDDLVGIDAASVRPALIDRAVPLRREQRAVVVGAREEERLDEGEEDGLTVFGFEEAGGGETGRRHHAVRFRLAKRDAEPAAAVGIADIRLADEGGVSGEEQFVGRHAPADGFPRTGDEIELEGRLSGGRGRPLALDLAPRFDGKVIDRYYTLLRPWPAAILRRPFEGRAKQGT